MNLKKRGNFFILIFLVSFILSPYGIKKIKSIYINSNRLFNKISAPNKSCIPPEIKALPNNSLLIIGHAYGNYKESKRRGDFGVAPKIIRFYKKNKNKIKTIIFSGDVLRMPNLEKWKLFYNNFDNDVVIHISPGNHDVGAEDYYPERRKIFEVIQKERKAKISYPYYFIDKNNLIILDDSNENKFDHLKINKIIDEVGYQKNIFIIRHHILTNSLKWSANMSGPQSLLNSKNINKLIPNKFNKKITYIYGDGRASWRLPRIDCDKIGQTQHILNGIGDLKKDLILVLVNEKLYSMEI
tara:strand:- start:914 stop:1807 length:894 start_codon:yes stop_codon:yes gene_type:complete